MCSRPYSISRQDIPLIGERYRKLAMFKQALYGDSFFTVKTHHTLHIEEILQDTGNLRHTWAYAQERENGQLKKVKRNNCDAHFWSTKKQQEQKFLADLLADHSPKSTKLGHSRKLCHLVGSLSSALTLEELNENFAELGTVTMHNFSVKRNDFIGYCINGQQNYGRVMHLLGKSDSDFALIRRYETNGMETETFLQSASPINFVTTLMSQLTYSVFSFQFLQ